MASAPVIDRETIDMLREMDEVTDESDLLLELIDDFLTHSQILVANIQIHAEQDEQRELASSSHSLKGASLNIGALILFQVCDKIELLARNQNLLDARNQLPNLTNAFQRTTAALIELRERTYRGETIDDLLGDDIILS